MARRREGQLVDNERRILMSALRLANGEVDHRFWVGDIFAALEAIGEAPVNEATANRALNRFVSVGWMWAAWETEKPDDRQSSRPRLYFRLNEVGITAARQVLRDVRRKIPVWALDPERYLHERISGDGTQVVKRKARR